MEGHYNEARGIELLRQMLGEQHEFREGQWDAIEIIVVFTDGHWLFREQGGERVLFIS